MKGEPTPELDCCHKTKPLRSTGSSLSPILDFQPCQGAQVRWNPSPIFEARLSTEGGSEEKNLKGLRFPPSPGPEHLYPSTSWGWALKVPETLSHALGAQTLLCAMRRDGTRQEAWLYDHDVALGPILWGL